MRRDPLGSRELRLGRQALIQRARAPGTCQASGRRPRGSTPGLVFAPAPAMCTMSMIHTSPRTACGALLLMGLLFACTRPPAVQQNSESRYQIDVPASHPLPALRIHLTTTPHTPEELTDSTLVELVNPVYLALRHCATSIPLPPEPSALLVVFEADTATPPEFREFEQKSLFPELLVTCMQGQITQRPVHSDVGPEFSLAVLVEVP